MAKRQGPAATYLAERVSFVLDDSLQVPDRCRACSKSGCDRAAARGGHPEYARQLEENRKDIFGRVEYKYGKGT